MNDIRAQLDQMYTAGKVHFPKRAVELTGVLGQIGESGNAWRAQSWSAGDPPSLRNAIAMNDEVYGLVRRAVMRWYEAANLVVGIANDFATQDDEAEEVFAGLTGDLYREPLHVPADPPTLAEVKEP